MGDGLFVHGGVTSAQEARLALAGLLALQGPTALDVRTGVMHGPGSTTLVTGTASTAPMQVAIGVHDGVLSRGAANGPYVMPTEAVQLVTVGAAPASGTRIDVVYEKQQDNTPGIPTPDGTAAPLYGVLAGTVGAGKPDLTAAPGLVGALELATVAVSAGATSTLHANVLITNTARQTVARGAEIPVRNQAERDALSPFWPLLTVKRLDTGNIEVRNAANSGWLTIAYTTAVAVAYFEGFVSAAQSLANSATWTDIVYDGEAYDTAGGHSGSSALYTIPTTGWWNVVASVGYATAAGARGVRLATVIGGTEATVRGSTTLVPANSLVGTSVATRLCRLFLNAGDQVKVQGYQNSGAALALVTGAGDQVGTFAATFERAV